MDKVLYALPTTHCNLSCKHCDIKSLPEEYNQELFIEQLTKFDGRIILFGGEPTLYEERLFDIIEADKNALARISSISTNLILLNDKLIAFYKTLHHISTSWNPQRFTEEEYLLWLSNCEWLHREGVKINVLITLTDDLFAMKMDSLLALISEWNSELITSINFEHYVGDTGPEYYQQADEWLCELYKRWTSPIPNKIVDRVEDWYYDCSQIYTLHPNGKITNGCPHKKTAVVPFECYSCERAAECRPCRLQQHCSYPKKFADLIRIMKEDK